MRYITILILILILGPATDTVFAQDNRYRVEILVLLHIESDQEPREVRRLEDFSFALDFLQPPSDEEEEATEEGLPIEASPGLPEDDLPIEPTEEGLDVASSEQDLLNAVVPVEELGPEMQDAWRRLRLSRQFRPLQYLAWEQGPNPPFPVLRVHDPDAVLIEDPWADQRAAEELTEAVDAPTVFSDIPMPEEDPAAVEEELPDPVVYYRLDGTASLSRQRFLHLALAVEWREPLFEPMPSPVTAPTVTSPGITETSEEPAPYAFLVHRLEQSRPIRTGRMEYFDGPVLGVLAWISDIGEPGTAEPSE